MLTTAHLILTGFGIGLLIAAPVGPVNILCIQRTLERGFWGGLAVGIGAVLGDGLLAVLAAFGVTAISHMMENHTLEIQLIGGLILMAFGFKLFFEEPNQVGPAGEGRLAKNWLVIPQTFFLTITNPGAVLGIFAIFSGVGSVMGGIRSYWDAGIIVLAVMGGSLFWWFGLAQLICRVRHRLTTDGLRLINELAGMVLVGFGMVLLVRAIISL